MNRCRSYAAMLQQRKQEAKLLHLTKREKQELAFAKGYSTKEIAAT